MPPDFPANCTTALFPGNGLVAMPWVQEEVTGAVVDGLMDMRPTDPAARLAGWTTGPPRGYTTFIDTMRPAGLFRRGGSCLASNTAGLPDIYETITCPQGFFRKSIDVVANG